jgi:UDP-GlcNAc:undecaprenyl-phosphate GlcNAc-1-phosphate transferase
MDKEGMAITIEGLIVGLLSFVMVLLFSPGYHRLLHRAELVQTNYRGFYIPVSAGLLPCVVGGLALAALSLLGNFQALLLGFGMVIAGLIGFLDDVAGDRQVSGLYGHFRTLWSNELSTGALKALAIVAVSLILATDRFTLWIIPNAAIIALSANTINLLDVRPSRSLKAALLIFLVTLPGVWGKPDLMEIWFLIILAYMAYAPFDFEAQTMLGDSGANSLGLGLGWLMIHSLQGITKVFVLAVLLLFTLFTEKTSFSRVIDQIPVLRFLDRLGTPYRE